MINIHQNIKEKLDYFHKNKRIPNIIFNGPSGSGKSKIVNDFITLIYDNNREKIKDFVMYVNCAHGKGIKFIRDELKFFAKTHINSNGGDIFKSIILLNGDKLTMDAQSALRRCIELFSHNTRFFIIVEDKYKMLKPILSRFCEIYVPDNNVSHFVGAEPIYQSYHSIHIQSVYGNADDLVRATFDKIRGIVGPDKTHQEYMEIADRLYEDGVSCMDVLNYLEANAGEARGAIVRLRFCYNKIKSEFRSEKMLMLYLFDFHYLRSNKCLKNISFL